MSETKTSTLRNRTYDELVRMIVSGDLRAGSQIDEKMLIETLGVSRTPFREAIAILASEGLIDVRPYRGFSVRLFSRKEVNDLYQLRRTLESFAVRLAVENISNADIARLEKILDNSVASLERGDLASYGVHDAEFHAMIAQLSDSSPLITVLERLSLQIQMCRTVANREPGFAQAAALERDAILKALRARDAEHAAMLLDAHIAHVQSAVLASLADTDAANDAAQLLHRKS